ncbi:MAG: hypothetical protein V9H25_06580 [Candidatus Competibacter sp.]
MIKRGPPAKNRQKTTATTSELASIFDVEYPAVCQWAKKEDFPQPEPNTGDGRETRYSTRAVIEWWLGIADYDKQRTRLLKAQADYKELEVAEKSNELCQVSEFIAFNQKLIASCKANLRDIAQTIGQQREDFETDSELEQAIRNLIDSALANLAKGFADYESQQTSLQ